MSRRVILALALVATPGLAADKPAKAPRKLDPDAVRCVRTEITGYLARTQKICMTNREWEQARDDARRMQTQTCADQTRCAGS